VERFLHSGQVAFQGKAHSWPLAGKTASSTRVTEAKLHQKGSCPCLEQPPGGLIPRRAASPTVEIDFYQTADHRPILVALRFLGPDKVGKREDVYQPNIGKLQLPTSPPQLLKWFAAVHDCHDVDANSLGIRHPGPEMAGVAAKQDFQTQGRYKDRLGTQLSKSVK